MQVKPFKHELDYAAKPGAPDLPPGYKPAGTGRHPTWFLVLVGVISAGALSLLFVILMLTTWGRLLAGLGLCAWVALRWRKLGPAGSEESLGVLTKCALCPPKRILWE